MICVVALGHPAPPMKYTALENERPAVASRSADQIRSDRFEPPQPPRFGVWYGYCAHASDAEGFGQSGKSCQRTELKAGPRDWSGWALRAHIVSDRAMEKKRERERGGMSDDVREPWESGDIDPPGRHRGRRAFNEGACFACAHPLDSQVDSRTSRLIQCRQGQPCQDSTFPTL